MPGPFVEIRRGPVGEEFSLCAEPSARKAHQLPGVTSFDVSGLGNPTFGEVYDLWTQGRTLGLTDQQIFGQYAAPRPLVLLKERHGRQIKAGEPLVSAVTQARDHLASIETE